VGRPFSETKDIHIKADRRVIGTTTTGGGTPQSTPISPTLFTIYMSALVGEMEEMSRSEGGKGMNTRGGKAKDRNRRKFIPLSYIDDVSSVRVGREDKMDKVLTEVAPRYRLKWDRSKDWVNEVHLGVSLNDK